MRDLKLAFSVHELLKPEDETRADLFGRHETHFRLTGNPKMDREIIDAVGLIVARWLCIQLGVPSRAEAAKAQLAELGLVAE